MRLPLLLLLCLLARCCQQCAATGETSLTWRDLHPSLFSHEDTDAQLAAAVARAAQTDGAALLAYGNFHSMAALPTFLQLLSRVHFSGSGRPYSQALVVSCLTPRSYEWCRGLHVDPALCLNDTRYGFDDAASGYDHRPRIFRALGLRKVAMIQAAVSSGVSAFVLDVDVSLLGDIFPVFEQHGADIVVTQDNCREFTHVQLDEHNIFTKHSLIGLQRGSVGQMINIGVMFVRAKRPGQIFVESWLRSMRGAWQTYDEKQDEGGMHSPWDQVYFHKTLINETLSQETPVKVQILSSDVFPHGCLNGGCGCSAASGQTSLQTCSALTISKWMSNHAACVRPWDKPAYMELAVSLKQGLTQFRHRSGTACKPSWGSASANAAATGSAAPAPAAAGAPWIKHENNPVLRAPTGAAFDITLIKANTFDMWFSWRDKRALGFSTSTDGLSWSAPEVALLPRQDVWWEREEVNRPSVLLLDGKYWMWYTGQSHTKQTSHIGLATSTDGKNWTYVSREPVLAPSEQWEQSNVMCPHVLWEPATRKFRMWYSGGEMNEPNAIGYAESSDGIHWQKASANPIFVANAEHAFERHKVTAAQVIKLDSVYVMYYVCFENEHLARVCVATSPDGLTGWNRASEPIVSPTPGAWDGDAVYKPFALPVGDKTYLYYNGRYGNVESIGLVVRDSVNLC